MVAGDADTAWDGMSPLAVEPTEFRPLANRIAAMTLALLVAASTIIVSLYPEYNWDMIPYIGVAFSYSIEDVEALHRLTYEAVRAGVDDQVYDELVNKVYPPPPIDQGYRHEMATHAEHFVAQLPFYATKPVYPLVIAGAMKAGLSPVLASSLISVVGYAAACLVILVWIRRHFEGLLWLLFGGILLFEPHLLALARQSTPDMLSALALLGASLCLLRLREVAPALAILVIAVFIRPDNLLFGGVLALVMLTLGALDWRRALVFLAAISLVYFAIAHYAGGYGWTTHFYFSNVERIYDLESFSSPLGRWDYLTIYAQNAAAVALTESVVLFAFLAVLAATLHFFAEGYRSRGFCISLSTILFMGLVLLAFPRESDRVLAGNYLIILLLVAGAGGLLAGRGSLKGRVVSAPRS